MVESKELERAARLSANTTADVVLDLVARLRRAKAFADILEARLAAHTSPTVVLPMIARLRRVDMVADTLEREAENAHVDTAALMIRIARELREK